MTRKKLVGVAAVVAVVAVAAFTAVAAFYDRGGAPTFANAAGLGTSLEGSDGSKDALFEGYEQGIADTIGCLQTAGVEVDIYPGRGYRPTMFTTNIPPVEGQDDSVTLRAANALSGECRAQHMDDAAEKWKEAYGTPSAAELEELYAMIEGCIASGGAGTAVVPYAILLEYREQPRQIEVAPEKMELYGGCAEHAQEITGFFAPAPWGS